MKTAVLIGYHGGQDYKHLAAVAALKRARPDWPHFYAYGCPYIDVMRATLVQLALEKAERDPELDRVLFFDHDIVFHPVEQVIRMVEEVGPGKPVVGAIYPMKTAGSGRLIGTFDPSLDHVNFFEGGELEPSNPRAGIGMGCTAIELDLFRRMVKALNLPFCPGLPVSGKDQKLYPFFALETSEEGYFGEDYSFCRRVWRMGESVWVDTRVRLWHMGSYPYVIEDAGAVVPQYETLRVNKPSVVDGVQKEELHIVEVTPYKPEAAE